MKIKGVEVFDKNVLNRYRRWLADNMLAGTPLVSHACPHCGLTLHCVLPPKGEIFDSYIRCVVCGDVALRIINNADAEPVVTIIKRCW